MNPRSIWLVLLATCAIGCMRASSPTPPPKQDEAPAPQAEEKPKSILKKTTQEIAKFDPAAGRKISDSKVNATTPLLHSLEAYGPMVEQVSKLGIQKKVMEFNALHGHWPTYEEFMEKIIKGQNVRLKVLPGKMEYQYDEAKHELVVVHPQEEPNADTKEK